ncbi:MAG: hypothetical protein Ct9H300mP11_30070 [Chloroflexota bacterium]|nr:MAG: hypothetical protein Ct9H300mP11_30070 [Chloroflexota bacterium]
MPGVGSTHYFVAYTWVHGSYPPLRQRLDPGPGETALEKAVIDLQEKVTVTGIKNEQILLQRSPFEPNPAKKFGRVQRQ